MNPRAPHVRVAESGERDHLVEVLVTAFDRDPLGRWLFPDPEDRRVKHTALFSRVLHTPRTGACIDVTDDLESVAIWHPPAGSEHAPPEAPPAIAGNRLFAAVDDAAPREPHWNLAFIGARVGGTGAGGALMRHRLARIAGPVALWTANEANLAFYRRFGFEVTARRDVDEASAWWLGKDLRGA